MLLGVMWMSGEIKDFKIGIVEVERRVREYVWWLNVNVIGSFGLGLMLRWRIWEVVWVGFGVFGFFMIGVWDGGGCEVV